MNTKEFRTELIKMMPGYAWTLHRKPWIDEHFMVATGIQSAGFNRLSTLEIERREGDEGVRYTARSSGYGKRAPWLSECTRPTLAQALRGLQSFYDAKASDYRTHANALQAGRRP